ncbi:MAG: hypothetical protein JNM34_01405, partial [Chthonomonadaceae bacterium]|nr:hypothetical protein [Chthonomonadaceae bacterium]
MRPNFKKLWAIMAGLAVIQGVIHQGFVFPKWKKDYAPLSSANLQGLTADQFLFALAGFRELIAGILWVRADTFFDEGNFDAILPIIRLVTKLDPHQIDVFSVGMWHIAYNFTDEGSRSDRRYIPSAVALGVEGTKANSDTYELFYETGWLYYNKIEDDYADAARWFEQAMERPDVITARRNIMNNAYQRAGELDKATDYLFKLYDEAEKLFEKEKGDFSVRPNRDVIENNLDTHIVRLVQRGYFARKNGYYDEGDYDTKPPFDVGFSVRATVVESKVLKIEGTWNVLPVGTRIKCILKDESYPKAKPAGMQWSQGDEVNLDPPKEWTYMQDSLFVRNQKFSRSIDMSRDPLMYPFTTEKYTLEFYYNPRQAPAYIQDKFGWSGEGMTDQNFLRTDVREGQRVVYAKFTLNKDQLLRR